MEILSTSMEGDAKQVQQNTALAKKEVSLQREKKREKLAMLRKTNNFSLEKSNQIKFKKSYQLRQVEEMKKEMQEKSRRMAELRSKLSKLRPEVDPFPSKFFSFIEKSTN